MMDCRRLHNRIDDLLDGQLSPAGQCSAEAHLQDCPHCSRAVEQARRLRSALRTLPVPPMPADFADRVIRRALAADADANAASGDRLRATSSRMRPAFAIAASLVIGIALGMYFSQPPVPDPVTEALPRVSLVVDQPRDVHLAFDTGTALRDVTVTLHLPDHIEVAGFPGERRIRWQTHLAEGRNRLSLPVIASGGSGGILIAELEHDGGSRTFEVRLDVAPQTGEDDHPLRI